MSTSTHPTFGDLMRCSFRRLSVVAIAFQILGVSWPALAVAADANSPSEAFGYGTKINFGKEGQSQLFKGTGWSATEDKFTWTEGSAAIVHGRVLPTDATITLNMTLAGLVKDPELPYQPVEVIVNNHKIADWQVAKTANFTVTLPPEVTKAGGELTILLKMPKATSPKALGQNADPRILGICCFDLELSKSG